MENDKPEKKKQLFTRYEIFIIAILAFLQFTVILDFMVLSPLSAQLLKELKVKPQEFSLVVSAYAVSAGISGLLSAGFADRFDRKKFLMFFYTGFVIGTLLCGIAPNYHFLLAARFVTGLFGGVVGSIGFAIITDLFRMEVRGRVMGFVQTAFAASQVLGIPVGLYLANELDWHAPFLLIVGLSVIVGVIIMVYMKPVNAHLGMRSEGNAFAHLAKTVSRPRYIRGFAATMLLATGGFMLMPFGSAFTVNNLGISQDNLPMVYLITGIFSMVIGPLSGKLADSLGKFKLFCIGSIWTIVIVSIYCNLGITPLWAVIMINTLMFMGVTSRIVSSSALTSAVPDPRDRGSYMSINTSIQYISGGISSYIAGLIVVQDASEKLHNYDVLGYVVAGATVVTMIMMYTIHKMLKADSTLNMMAPENMPPKAENVAAEPAAEIAGTGTGR